MSDGFYCRLFMYGQISKDGSNDGLSNFVKILRAHKSKYKRELLDKYSLKNIVFEELEGKNND